MKIDKNKLLNEDKILEELSKKTDKILKKLLKKLKTKVGLIKNWLNSNKCKFRFSANRFFIYTTRPLNKHFIEKERDFIQKKLLEIGDYELQIKEIEAYDKDIEILSQLIRLRNFINILKRKRRSNILKLCDPNHKYFYFNPRIIEVLQSFPEFENFVIEVRKKYKIDPERINKEIIEIVKNKENFSLVKAIDSQFFLSYPKFKTDKKNFEKKNKKIIELRKKVEDWENKKFPGLWLEILKFKIMKLWKIPRDWYIPIKDYILYNRVSDYPLLVRKSRPEININVDPKFLKAYIEVKIYEDTDLDKWDLKYIRKIQKSLPDYYKIDEKMIKTLCKRWIYYFLRKKMKFTNKEANGWLKSLGFSPIFYTYTTQELKRFEALFKKNQNREVK